MPSPAPHACPSGAIVHPLPPGVDPLVVFGRLRGLPHCVFFDSSTYHESLGRYSFLAADPFEWITCEPTDDGFAALAQAIEPFATKTLPGLPPFQGGAAGLFSYDLCHALEKLPTACHNEFPTPAMAVGLYDVVFAFDHHSREAWVISQGFPETHTPGRAERAERRLDQFLRLLDGEDEISEPAPPASESPSQHAAPQFPLAGHPAVSSDFSREDYLRAVARVVEYIHAGDVFQVNLSQRLLASLREAAHEYYLRLRCHSPAPFAAYFDAGDAVLCSASPERFLSVEDSQVETRPIKGTRPRSDDPDRDRRASEELLASAKDRAENTMIVDLLRNDLSRVCVDGSVRVPTLCGLESYEQVHHLVSVVRGELRPAQTSLDLLRAAMPGGSVTGAPKVRAMEIIAELEPTARGPYCGSLGYVGFNGAMDSSILIRTAIASRGCLQMPVGGGVVADSDPVAEYDETLQKAAGMLAALK